MLVVEGWLCAEVNRILSAMTSNIVNLCARPFHGTDRKYGHGTSSAFGSDCSQKWKVQVSLRQRAQTYAQTRQMEDCHSAGCRPSIAPEQVRPSIFWLLVDHTSVWSEKLCSRSTATMSALHANPTTSMPGHAEETA